MTLFTLLVSKNNYSKYGAKISRDKVKDKFIGLIWASEKQTALMTRFISK